MGRKLKFPESRDYKSTQPAILCPAERVIGLYNQNSGEAAKKISKKVRKWFFEEANKHGWIGGHFLPEVQSNYGAGCILWRPPDRISVEITTKEEMLILSPENE